MGFHQSQKENSLRSLENYCLSKEHGGLGLQSTHLKNKIMLIILAWRLFTNSLSLSEKTLNMKYYKQTATKKFFISQNITMGNLICNDNTAWSPNNGYSIRFWFHRWIPNSPPLNQLVQGPLRGKMKLLPFLPFGTAITGIGI